MKIQTTFTGLVMTTLLLVWLILSPLPTYAQNPPPPEDPEQSWNPPEEGGEPFMPPGVESKSVMSFYPTPRPGTLPSIKDAYFVDGSGQRQTRFGNEPFYLVVLVNSPGCFYVAEYYPRDSGLLPHWVIYRQYLVRGGLWKFGPFYPESGEPEGQHTWKLWLYASGAWAQRVVHFNYQPYYPYPPYPYPPMPAPVTVQTSGNWGTVQVIVVAVLAGALGITIGVLISNRQRYMAK